MVGEKVQRCNRCTLSVPYADGRRHIYRGGDSRHSKVWGGRLREGLARTESDLFGYEIWPALSLMVLVPPGLVSLLVVVSLDLLVVHSRYGTLGPNSRFYVQCYYCSLRATRHSPPQRRTTESDRRQ